VIDEIPREELIGFLPAVDVKVGIDVHLPEGLRPIAFKPVDREKQLSHPPVAQGEQGLDVIPLRQVMGDRHRLLAVQAILDSPDLLLTTAVSSRGHHWNGVAGFGMNWLILSVRLRNPFFPAEEVAGSVFHCLHQTDDGIRIFIRLCGEADHEVES